MTKNCTDADNIIYIIINTHHVLCFLLCTIVVCGLKNELKDGRSQLKVAAFFIRSLKGTEAITNLCTVNSCTSNFQQGFRKH